MAHKCFLSAQSLKFREVLNKMEEEEKKEDNELLVIKIEDANFETM